MAGGGAQSSVSLKWLDLVCSHFMTHPFFNIKTKQIVFEAKVLKVIFCIFLQTDQNPFSVIKRFLYTSCKPPINGIFCKESILTELASSAVNHQFLKKRWRGHPELTRSLWLWFSKTKGLMQQRNCKKHPEVSAPVHISADRTPLMDGGGAQSSLKMCLIGLDVS